MTRLWLVCVGLLFIAAADPAAALERFPPPDFSAGHVLPETRAPAVQSRTSATLDVAALTLGLAMASWLSLKRRSRVGIVVLSLASLAYFGFWRRGCVCSIGSIQNVALGLTDSSFAVPLAVTAFFALPLVFTLVWGRGFCAGVCPHGALQDLVLVKPLKVPAWLDEVLRVVPWLHLALAVLLATSGGLFIICKFDPFVGIFRLTGPRLMMISGAVILVLSMFVGRPYCRYLCPYGTLLGVAARFAKWRPTVTPAACTQCRLCESSCPFGALNHPSPVIRETAGIASQRRRIVIIAAITPLAALAFGWLGGLTGIASLPLHPDGRLAAVVLMQERGEITGPAPDELAAHQHSGITNREAFVRAAALESRLLILGRVIGAAFGLALGIKLARAILPRHSSDYETDSGRCVSCARCFSACPYELQRRGIPVEGGSHGPT